MAIVFRRETFIALRARRQAYRIASDIINPYIKDNRPIDEPKTPIEITLPPLARRKMPSSERWTLLVVIAIVVGFVMGAVMSYFKVSL